MTAHLVSVNSDHTYSSTCCLSNLSKCLGDLCRQNYPRGWRTVVCGLNSAHIHFVNRVSQNTANFRFSGLVLGCCRAPGAESSSHNKALQSLAHLLPVPLHKELADPQSALFSISSKFHLMNIQYFTDGYLVPLNSSTLRIMLH